MSTFAPENIVAVDGKFLHDGVDVTHRLVWWRCPLGHEWQASLATRTAPADAGCPTCAVAGFPVVDQDHGDARPS